MSKLFSEWSVRDVTLKNRIVMSPMCMYSCDNEDGLITDWHKVHYASRALGQVGLIILEATAVHPQGRISSRDLGIWEDSQIDGLRETVELIHQNGSKAAIQLAHAGRKATVEGPIYAPSAIPFDENSRVPEVMTIQQIEQTIEDFKSAAVRVKKAGFDVIELHAAHGYLLNEFLSPLCNHRNDEYGGDEQKRFRLLEQIIQSVREVWDGPLFVRISANEYNPKGTTLETFIYYARQMKKLGVDLIDCSSGGVVHASINSFPGYQVPRAEAIRKQAEIATGTVGLITHALQAEEILQNERADLILLARELLRDPFWPRTAATQLGEQIQPPKQYDRAW